MDRIQHVVQMGYIRMKSHFQAYIYIYMCVCVCVLCVSEGVKDIHTTTHCVKAVLNADDTNLIKPFFPIQPFSKSKQQRQQVISIC